MEKLTFGQYIYRAEILKILDIFDISSVLIER